VASVGVAPNMFLAKIASDLEKPDAFVVVDPASVQSFLDPLPVARLWGVGHVTGQVFEQLGIRTIGEVRQMALEQLRLHFGNSGEHLWQLAHGLDHRRVIPDREAKSISHETTFAIDIDDREVLRAWLVELAEQVGWRLRRQNIRGRTVQLKVRFADFRTITRAKSLAESTNTTGEIRRIAGELLDECLSAPHQRIRLLGAGLSNLQGARLVQRTLFDAEDREKQVLLDQAADQIRERFGATLLQRGSGLLHGAEHKPVPRPPGNPPPAPP
jgi:DNA polymerase-4